MSIFATEAIPDEIVKSRIAGKESDRVHTEAN